MIIDCHTHVWESPEQLGNAKLDVHPHNTDDESLQRQGNGWPDASLEQHWLASEPVDKAFVLGFKSRYMGADIPSTLVSAYVKEHPEKLIGVAGIDPTDPTEALADIRQAHEELGMRAITLSPAAQDFHPADSRAMQVYTEAARLDMPVFLDQGVRFGVASKMEFARPVLFDEVARELPELKLLIAHMGYPWVEECIVLLGKHTNVFADISSLLHRPWHLYNALLSAYQYGVMDKLLFGSDFPFCPATRAIESLYRINQLVTGTNLPTVPRSFLTSIVECNSLAVLGLEEAAPSAREKEVGLLDEREP